MSGVRAPILQYYALRAVSSPGFIWPVSVLYLVDHGVTYATLGMAGAATALVVVLGEVPTGYLSDRVGRRSTVAVAQLLFGCFPLALLFARTPAAVVGTYALLGLAETVQSGAVDAWLYDTLDGHDAAGEYTRIQGRGGAIRFWVLAATIVAGGVLYAFVPRVPFVATAAMAGVGATIAATLPSSGHGDGADPLSPRAALRVVRGSLSSPALRGMVALSALLVAVIRAGKTFVQPIAREGLAAVLADVTVAGRVLPETAVLGLLYASFMVVGALLSDRAAAFERRVGTRRAVALVVVSLGATMLLPLLAPLLIVPMMFVLRGSISLFVPIRKGYVNRHTESAGRATVLSANSMVYAVAKVPFALGAGLVGDAFGPAIAVGSLGTALLAGTAAIYVWNRPVHEARPAPASAD